VAVEAVTAVVVLRLLLRLLVEPTFFPLSPGSGFRLVSAFLAAFLAGLEPQLRLREANRSFVALSLSLCFSCSRSRSFWFLSFVLLIFSLADSCASLSRFTPRSLADADALSSTGFRSCPFIARSLFSSLPVSGARLPVILVSFASFTSAFAALVTLSCCAVGLLSSKLSFLLLRLRLELLRLDLEPLLRLRLEVLLLRLLDLRLMLRLFLELPLLRLLLRLVLSLL